MRKRMAFGRRGSVHRGFTLVETLAVLGVVALGGVHFSKINDQVRIDSFERQSAAKLARIGQGHAMYALDNGGRIATYSWRGPRDGEDFVAYKLPDGLVKTAYSDIEAAQWQNTEILMRRTGRIDGPYKIQRINTLLPHTRLVHLPLMDYMDLPFPGRLFAEPADAAMLMWQSNPLDISAGNGIPYAGQVGQGYTSGFSFSTVGARQRWAFSSSYISTMSAWQGDGLTYEEPKYVPISDTPHLLAVRNPDNRPVDFASGRSFAEVFAPSGKVHMFEEFDRRRAGVPFYFGYNNARVLKLMFDGAINNRRSAEANASWNPGDGVEWRQTYVPLDQFPLPQNGLGETNLLSQRYRWTRLGLQGIDYTP